MYELRIGAIREAFDSLSDALLRGATIALTQGEYTTVCCLETGAIVEVSVIFR